MASGTTCKSSSSSVAGSANPMPVSFSMKDCPGRFRRTCGMEEESWITLILLPPSPLTARRYGIEDRRRHLVLDTYAGRIKNMAGSGIERQSDGFAGADAFGFGNRARNDSFLSPLE